MPRRSDADGDVLAEYVLALLRHDGDINTVRQLCLSEIPDFLQEDTEVFVRDVFDAIQYRSYIPGAAPPRRPSIPFAPPSGPSIPMYSNPGIGGPPGQQNMSRKRTFNERGDGDSQDRGFQPGPDSNGRVYKQARGGGSMTGRGQFGNSGRGSFDAGRSGYPPSRPSINSQGISPEGFAGMPTMPSPPPGFPPMDPNNPLASLLSMQAMGFPLPGMPMPDPRASPRPMVSQRKERCRDYDQKGFCARGNTCPFEHGEHSVWIPPAQKTDEYDPTKALMTSVEGPGGFDKFRGSDRGRGRGVNQRGNGQFVHPSRRNGRAEFSSDKPNYDKSHTTIVVENIPEESFTEEAVREFFSEFGKIVEVDMRPYKRLAIVKFDDWVAANTAYKSPKVIFDNRFVKVYWFVSQDSLPKPPLVRESNGAQNGKSNAGAPVPVKPVSEPQIDPEEFARKQQEAQKIHDEKLKKSQDMEAAKKELERRQEELLKRQAEEKRKLIEKIAAKSKSSTTPPGGSKNGILAPGEPRSQTDLLKEQLAALEAEAQAMGIDPSAPEDGWGATRGRGRGRGGYRGRGNYVPRARGGYRGRGGAPFVPGGRSFNLDNRPKKVGLVGVDFSDAEKDESLRQYLLVSALYLDCFGLN